MKTQWSKRCAGPGGTAGIALIFPDTSPREGVCDDEAYDLGQGAGFYVNATQYPGPHFQMWITSARNCHP